MNYSRRQLLKNFSLGATGFVLPSIANQLLAQANGTAGQTQRFVFVVKSSGLTPGAIVPTSMADLTTLGKAQKSGDNYTTGHKLNASEKLIDRPLANAKLSDSLTPLNSFKDRMMILQGLSGQMVNGGHMSGYGAMSCVRGNGGSNGAGTPIAETIDSMMSRAFPSVFPHLGLSLVTRTMTSPGAPPADSVCYPGISAAGMAKPLPFQGSPTQAFRSLFGSVGEGDAKAKFALTSRVLDMMSGDVKRLAKGVPSAEREKLGFHLEAIEGLQRRHQAIAARGEAIRKAAPTPNEKYQSMNTTDRLDAHFDIAAGALIAGLTNVVTIRADGLSTTYPDLGLGANVHGIGHGNAPKSESPDAARDKIRKFHLQQVAKLAGQLKAVPEGNGSMLDNTTIIYFSDVGNKHHASNKEWPFIVVGNVGGKLNSAGRYIQYPGKGADGHHTIANWWMTLLHAIGKPQDSFGMKDSAVPAAAQNGPLANVLA